MVDVAANYRAIVDRVKRAALRVGRDPREIKILAASKTQTVESIEAAISAGVSCIGENYVQEAKSKKQIVSLPVEWHMIGHLQRNKVKAAVGVFDVIQSLDNVALATELDREARKKNVKVRTLIEINLGGEESKSGILKGKVRELLQAVGELPQLNVEGLMTIPPFRHDCEEIRPYFRQLRELKEALQSLSVPNVDLRELSMGMTHDFAVAVEEGATIVRIGTALFGPRRR